MTGGSKRVFDVSVYVVVRGRTWSYVVVHGRCTRSKTKQIKRTEHKRSMNVARSVQKSVNNDVLFFFIYMYVDTTPYSFAVNN